MANLRFVWLFVMFGNIDVRYLYYVAVFVDIRGVMATRTLFLRLHFVSHPFYLQEVGSGRTDWIDLAQY